MVTVTIEPPFCVTRRRPSGRKVMPQGDASDWVSDTYLAETVPPLGGPGGTGVPGVGAGGCGAGGCGADGVPLSPPPPPQLAISGAAAARAHIEPIRRRDSRRERSEREGAGADFMRNSRRVAATPRIATWQSACP